MMQSRNLDLHGSRPVVFCRLLDVSKFAPGLPVTHLLCWHRSKMPEKCSWSMDWSRRSSMRWPTPFLTCMTMRLRSFHSSFEWLLSSRLRVLIRVHFGSQVEALLLGGLLVIDECASSNLGRRDIRKVVDELDPVYLRPASLQVCVFSTISDPSAASHQDHEDQPILAPFPCRGLTDTNVSRCLLSEQAKGLGKIAKIVERFHRQSPSSSSVAEVMERYRCMLQVLVRFSAVPINPDRRAPRI